MNEKIKIDLSKLLKNNSPVILELGCGNKKKSGRIAIDKLNLPNVDIVCDLENGLPFFPDNSVDEIHSTSFIEHVDNFEFLMKEFVRVLKKNGKCYTFVPHFSNPYYYSDYTHSKFFGLYTFYYFVDQKYQLKRKVPNFYSDIKIKMLSLKLMFSAPSVPYRHKNFIKRLCEYIFNKTSGCQEFYETNLCYILPCYGMQIIFSPDK